MLSTCPPACRHTLLLCSADLLNTSKTELILAIPYEGDALRVYYKDKLLTDNWFSGYSSEQGGAVVGLSYLADENPGCASPPPPLSVCVRVRACARVCVAHNALVGTGC